MVLIVNTIVLLVAGSVWGDKIYDKTVCMDYEQNMGRHYDVHNLYGWSEAEPSLRFMLFHI